MAKLTFPAVTKPYRGFIEQVRGWVNTMASFVERNPASALPVVNTMVPLLDSLNVETVVNAQTVVVNNSADSKTVDGAATVVAGELTKVKLAATEAIVSSTLALTGVTPSGTYTDTVTFTVAAGVITAIVLS